MSQATVRQAFRELADAERARNLSRFFKTGAGEYGEGDRFHGIRVPEVRKLVARFWSSLAMQDVLILLHSPMHEERLFALLVWVRQYAVADPTGRDAIARAYLANTASINNWDLVDLSAPHILGPWLADKERSLLDQLAGSVLLWERRIAVLATFHFIRLGEFDDALRIAGLLLEDRHDLIHKAVGWMLREIGKRNLQLEEAFLQRHRRRMPRTMLRYAIERFPEPKRQQYLSGSIGD